MVRWGWVFLHPDRTERQTEKKRITQRRRGVAEKRGIERQEFNTEFTEGGAQRSQRAKKLLRDF
jgi:hypothetical protein